MATATRKIKTEPKKAGIKPKPTPKAAVTAAPAKTAKSPVAMYDITTRYVGSSSPIRSGKNLSPVVVDRVPNSFTDRDESFLRDLHGKFGTKSFQRLNLDGGALSRLIGHGYLEHKAGGLDERTAEFAITSKAVSERFRKA